MTEINYEASYHNHMSVVKDLITRLYYNTRAALKTCRLLYSAFLLALSLVLATLNRLCLFDLVLVK